jgi:hypothetical protein
MYNLVPRIARQGAFVGLKAATTPSANMILPLAYGATARAQDVASRDDRRPCRESQRDLIRRTPEATNEPTNRKRNRHRRIGPGLDVFPDRLFEASSLASDDLGRVAGGFAGLPVQVLGRADRLLHRALDLAFDVSGGASKTFLELAARVLDGAFDAIFVHDVSSL